MGGAPASPSRKGATGPRQGEAGARRGARRIRGEPPGPEAGTQPGEGGARQEGSVGSQGLFFDAASSPAGSPEGSKGWAQAQQSPPARAQELRGATQRTKAKEDPHPLKGLPRCEEPERNPGSSLGTSGFQSAQDSTHSQARCKCSAAEGHLYASVAAWAVGERRGPQGRGNTSRAVSPLMDREEAAALRERSRSAGQRRRREEGQ